MQGARSSWTSPAAAWTSSSRAAPCQAIPTCRCCTRAACCLQVGAGCGGGSAAGCSGAPESRPVMLLKGLKSARRWKWQAWALILFSTSPAGYNSSSGGWVNTYSELGGERCGRAGVAFKVGSKHQATCELQPGHHKLELISTDHSTSYHAQAWPSSGPGLAMWT